MEHIIFAPCKVNLSLDIKGKNAENMHILSSIMMCINLKDEIRISIEKSDKPEISLKTNIIGLPTDDQNIVVKCIKKFYEKFKICDKISVFLQKNIPTCAGLGGGSSDGTEMLLLLDKYYGTNMTENELTDFAISLGSDCPFFLKKDACLVEGIGEKITPLENAFLDENGNTTLDIKTITPNIKVSTKEIYELYDKFACDKKNALYIEEKAHANAMKTKNIIEALRTKNINLLKENMYNDLEMITTSIHKEVLDLKNKMKNENGFAMMSGSGPSVFSILGD